MPRLRNLSLEEPCEPLGVKNHDMKKHITLIIAASTLLLAGCSSTHHASKQWEYKVALTPAPKGTRPVGIEGREQFLNELAKEGWILVSADSDLFYLKRPIK